MKRTRIIGAVALATCAAIATGEPIVVSIHTPANLLVSVDPATGQVIDLGLIGPGVEGAVNDIASDGTHVFVLTTLFPGGGRLYEVDPGTGQVLSSAIISVDGNAATNAIEAIGFDGGTGNLMVSLWRPPTENTFVSSHIGQLAPTGEVTGIQFLGPVADADGLGRDPAGGMVALDREPGDMTNTLSNVTYDPTAFTDINEIDFTPTFNGVDDAAVFSGDIITIDSITKRINRHDRASGDILSSVPYTPAYTLSAVAVVDLNPPACAGDLNGDGDTSSADLNILLGDFGCTPGDEPCGADLDDDGDTDSADLNILLGAFGCTG